MTTPPHLRATAAAMRESGTRLENARPTDYEGVMLGNELQAAAMRLMEYVEKMERTHERKEGDA